MIITLAPRDPTPAQALPTETTVPGDATVEAFLPTATQIQPTVPPITALPTISLAEIQSVSVMDVPSRAFAIGAGGGTTFSLPGSVSNPTLFVRNPARPNDYAITDALGQMTVVVNGQAIGLPAPFTGFPVESRANNDRLVTDAAWSPDGRYLAFVIDNINRRDANDGVWWWEVGVSAPVQVMHNCRPGTANCTDYVNASEDPYVDAGWYAKSVVWSPTSDRILARLFMGNYGRDGLIVLPRTFDENYKKTRGTVCKYEFGDWTPDGQRVVVSGRDFAGAVELGTIEPLSCAVVGQVVGFWAQNAVMSGGRMLALGSANGEGTPVAIIDENGTPLTETIGSTPPVEVKWNPSRDTVFVRTSNGESFLASVSGEVRNISGSIGGLAAVNWVQGNLPPAGGIAPIPEGVVEDSEYSPGQQLQVSSTTGGLNLRTQPVIAENVIRYVGNGENVRIIAGPTDAGGVRWWRVRTAFDEEGWIAGAIGASPVLIPAP
ncbi:MAG: SH3 domain-containing protein [Chloroflexi bacterium]|nr:SH3 domain-containing protein [Chloroflexota bacterium]